LLFIFPWEYTCDVVPIFTKFDNNGETIMAKKNKMKVPREALKTAYELTLEQEALVLKIVAICWEQLGRGANINIDHKCYDKAIAMGALENLRKRLSQEPAFSDDELKDAKWCSHEAGRKARKIARKPEFNSEFVTDEIFELAFNEVKDGVDKLNERRAKNKEAIIEAVYC
jgi:hypothetical protein